MVAKAPVLPALAPPPTPHGSAFGGAYFSYYRTITYDYLKRPFAQLTEAWRQRLVEAQRVYLANQNRETLAEFRRVLAVYCDLVFRNRLPPESPVRHVRTGGVP